MWPFRRREIENKTMDIAEENLKRKKMRIHLTPLGKLLTALVIIGVLNVVFLGVYSGGALSYLCFRFMDGIIYGLWFFSIPFALVFIVVSIFFIVGWVVLPSPVIMFVTSETNDFHRHLVLKAPKPGTNYEFPKVTSMDYSLVIHKDDFFVYGFWIFKTYIVRDPVTMEKRENKIFLTTSERKGEKAELNRDRINELETDNRLLRRRNANMIKEFKLEKEVVVKRKEGD